MHANGASKNTPLMRNLSFIALSLIAFACAAATDAPVVTSCELPSDQSGTLHGFWTLKPIPIAFHAGDFSTSEMTAMVAAANTWNQFYSSSQKFQIIDYGSASSPRTSSNAKPLSQCGETIIGTGAGALYSAPVVIYKDATWPSTYGSQTIALTSYCLNTTATTAIKPMTMAYVEINYQNYFTTSEVPDLQTIVLHELGHVAGLGHSCEVTGSSGVPDCSTNDTYTDAVMAPVFPFNSSGAGVQKRALTSNDEGRANCLYDGGITGTTN
jgi:hypothetical protein